MMSRCYFRVALSVTAAALSVVVGGWGAVASAADCEVPAFLETGKSYEMRGGMETAVVKVVEVDRQTCWMRTEDDRGRVRWVNLNQVFSIGEHKPVLPAPSGQPR
jgi:hypothetical protein